MATARTGDLLRMPTGAEFLIAKSAADSGGERVEMEITIPPGSPSPPRHFHPHQEELQEVLVGTLSVYVDGQWRLLEQGQSLSIPAGQAHTLRNRSAEVVRIKDVHVPALDFQDYIEKLHRLAQAGKVTSLRSPATLTYLSMVLREHRGTQVTSSPLQRVLESVLARVGKLLGYRTD
jgi:quercetin dioxygenase-like cupin family protein